MGYSEVRERCLSAPTKEDALTFLEQRYWFNHITPTEYNRLKTEIYKEFRI